MCWVHQIRFTAGVAKLTAYSAVPFDHIVLLFEGAKNLQNGECLTLQNSRQKQVTQYEFASSTKSMGLNLMFGPAHGHPSRYQRAVVAK